MDTTQNTLANSQMKFGMNDRKPNGGSQPPRNMITHSVETRIMLAYSARKNMANAMPEYSTMWPATISDSPSTTSNGWRLVSARPEMKYTKKIGSSGSQFQERKVRPRSAIMPLPCKVTISPMFIVPETISTTTSAKPIAIS